MGNEPITKEEFNRLVSQVKFYHYRPQQIALKELKAMMERHHKVMADHIESDALFFAKLSGAKWALWAIVALVAPIVPILYYLIKALALAKII